MSQNKLMIAAAGSGKTTYLVTKALEVSGENVLITTYTEENEREIRRKIIDKNGSIPPNITVQTWFSFLLQHGVKPYQGSMNSNLFGKRIGFYLSSEKSACRNRDRGKGKRPIYWGKDDFPQYYFTNDWKVYSDKISLFIFECNKITNGKVIDRISRIYRHIFVDEVQDLAGWDLEVIKMLFGTQSKILLVGDPRQVAYLTNHAQKNKKYENGKIDEFIRSKCSDLDWEIDEGTLSRTHRNNQSICDFSSQLFLQYQHSIPCDCVGCRRSTTNHEGVFLVKSDDKCSYVNTYSPQILKFKSSKFPELNYGKSKGLTFDRVLIFPTSEIKKWIRNRDSDSDLADTTRCKFYIAITRAKHSVGIIYDYDENDEFEDVIKWNEKSEYL